MAPEGAGDREFLIYLLIYSNKLAYVKLTTVLIYESIPPKGHEQSYLNFSQKPWETRVNEFIFRTWNFNKNELSQYFSWILLKKVSEDFF